MRHATPVIGINCDYDPKRPGHAIGGLKFAGVIERLGGTPLFLPAAGPKAIARQLDAVDGVILTGGRDLPPERIGMTPRPEITPVEPIRAGYDLALMDELTRRSMPVLAICLGIQLLNVGFAGDLVGDIPADVPHALVHFRREPYMHRVEIVPGTRLASVLAVAELAVNSTHHQSVRRLGDGLKVAARASDGVIEAVELDSDRFALGLQWHPERLLGQEIHRRPFEAFLKAASA